MLCDWIKDTNRLLFANFDKSSKIRIVGITIKNFMQSN